MVESGAATLPRDHAGRADPRISVKPLEGSVGPPIGRGDLLIQTSIIFAASIESIVYRRCFGRLLLARALFSEFCDLLYIAFKVEVEKGRYAAIDYFELRHSRLIPRKCSFPE